MTDKESKAVKEEETVPLLVKNDKGEVEVKQVAPDEVPDSEKITPPTPSLATINEGNRTTTIYDDAMAAAKAEENADDKPKSADAVNKASATSTPASKPATATTNK